MTDGLKSYLQNVLLLSEEQLELFLGKFRKTTLKKGALFVKDGQFSNKIGLILSGAVMSYYNKDGEDAIIEFSFENQFIADYPGILNNTPSDKSIKCIEDTTLLVSNASDIKALFDIDPAFERMGRIIAETLFTTWYYRLTSFLLDDAETRYTKLVENRPELPQRVPQYLIAAYLGIKPESLSRIRKKLTL